MTSKAAWIGGALSVGALAMWVAAALPAGRHAHDAATEFSRASAELDARLPSVAGPEVEQRVLEVAQARARVCDVFEAPRLAASAAIFDAPLDGVAAGASIDELRRVLGVRRQDAGREATLALRAAGGPDLPGWPITLPTWIEPSAPDPAPDEMARDLARFRIEVTFATALASAGASATEAASIAISEDAGERRVKAVLRFAVPTRGVSAAVQKSVVALQACGSVVRVSGLSAAPPPTVRSGFGGDPPVDVVLALDAVFPGPRRSP